MNDSAVLVKHGLVSCQNCTISCWEAVPPLADKKGSAFPFSQHGIPVQTSVLSG